MAAANPWDRPEHRYTYDDVKRMDRSEFDARRALHGRYGGQLSDADIAAQYDDPNHPIRVVSAHISSDENDMVPMVELRHDHLARNIVAPDVMFGDSVTPELYRQWAARHGLDQGTASQGRLDAEYMGFNERQYAELTAHGRRRQTEAKQFMAAHDQHQALRGAYKASGRSADLYRDGAGTQTGQNAFP